MTYRNKHLSEAISSLGVCARCLTTTPTTHCHSNQSKFGKGKSLKASDAAQWSGCGPCHTEIDQGHTPRALRVRDEERAIARTYHMLASRGYLHGDVQGLSKAGEWVNALETGRIVLNPRWRQEADTTEWM